MSIKRSHEVWIHPARYSGKPCVGQTRVPVDTVAWSVWLDGSVDATAIDYEVDRETVLVACWYAGLYGTVDPYQHRPPGNGRQRFDRTWIRRWRAWADQWGGAMWSGHWDGIPDPPTREDQ